jgi:2-methylcitrate dehydratase PrpD
MPHAGNSALADADAADIIALFASRLCFDDLPSEIVNQTKQSIVDTVGIALAGASLGEGSREMIAYAASQGGAPVASVWSANSLTTPTMAALVNGALARVLDFDDIIDFPQVHIAACIVPAALAIAESRPHPVDGSRLIAAIAAGAELQARLAGAIAPYLDVHEFPKLQPTQIFGYFAAALGAGLLLELTPDRLTDALGLALMQSAGTQELVVHSAVSVGKGIYSGFSAQGGVQSALMASSGIVARGHVLDGTAGLFAAHYGGRYDRDALVGGLGHTFLSATRCFKLKPGTLVAHAFVEAALQAKSALKADAGAIAYVMLRVGPWGKAMCEPLAMRRRPQTSAAAMNNIPFCVATALVNGGVQITDFEAGGRERSDVLAMVDRIQYALDESLANARGLEPGIVELTTADGRKCSKRVDHPRGHHRRPASDEELARKFRDNLIQAGNTSEHATAFLARVEALEGETDIRDLVNGLRKDLDDGE